MFFSGFLTFCLFHQAYAIPPWSDAVFKRGDAVFTLKDAQRFTSRRELNISDNVLGLNELKTTPKSSRALLSGTRKTGRLESVAGGVTYAVDVDVSGETFALIFDTGSSDLWVAQSGFICGNAQGQRVPEAECGFGPLFRGGFSDGKIRNQNFNIGYGDGSGVAGILGYEDVTVAGVTVKHQEMALVQEAIFVGDGTTSGIIGFAYPSLTNAFKGNDPSNDPNQNPMHYKTFLAHAIKQDKIDSLFSIVLERGAGQSQLALGGLPTTKFKHDFTTVPLQIYEFTPSAPPQASKKYTYYTIQIDGVVINGQRVNTKPHVIVDSGTSLTYLPSALTERINKAFDPPARYVSASGVWETNCDAKPPSFSIRIGGTPFHISSAEVLLPKEAGYDTATGLCVTGIQSFSAQQPSILGATFLKNVVAVFDIGAAEMRFAPHVNY